MFDMVNEKWWLIQENWQFPSQNEGECIHNFLIQKVGLAWLYTLYGFEPQDLPTYQPKLGDLSQQFLFGF